MMAKGRGFHPSTAAKAVNRYVETHHPYDHHDLVASERARRIKLKIATRLRRAFRLLLLLAMFAVLAVALLAFASLLLFRIFVPLVWEAPA